MEVSINGGTPKWMVYSGKAENKMDENWGYPHFRKPPYGHIMYCKKVDLTIPVGTQPEVSEAKRSKMEVTGIEKISDAFRQVPDIFFSDSCSVMRLHISEFSDLGYISGFIFPGFFWLAEVDALRLKMTCLLWDHWAISSRIHLDLIHFQSVFRPEKRSVVRQRKFAQPPRGLKDRRCILGWMKTDEIH